MSRPNSHSITKATDFVKQLFKKDAQEKITTQKETEPMQTLSLSDRESAKDKKVTDKYHRADTTAGIMNKFILQFSRVEQAYREIEKAFLNIVSSDDGLEDKMKRKCEVKFIRPILEYLGYPDFNDSELKQIFNKDVTADDQITFKRLLVGSGLCYYEKQPKKVVHNWTSKKKSKTDSDNNNNNNNNSEKGKKEHTNNGSSDYETDDEKIFVNTPSIDEDDLIVDPSAARRRRFRHISQGFDVVKQMFDKIDDDSSGEITHSEFKQAFMDICRDLEIVDARMAELDYNKDQEITFREFIFGIASWVGFNDPLETRDDEMDTHESMSNNKDTNESNKQPVSNGSSVATMVNNYSNNDANNDATNASGDDGKNDEPTVTETEDASFMNKTDKESNVEKTYKVVSPKASDATEHSQGKDASTEKSASKSNEISGPPPGYMD